MRGAVRVGVFAVLTTGLTACWPVPGQGPDRRAQNAAETAINVATVGDLALEWTADVGRVRTDPVVSAAGVHVMSEESNSQLLHGIDSGTGAVNWSTSGTEDNGFLWGPVSVDGDRVALGEIVDGPGGPISRWHWYDTTTGERIDGARAGYASSLRPPHTASIVHGIAAPDVLVGLAVQNESEGTRWTGLLAVESSLDPTDPGLDVTVGQNLVFHSARGWNRTEPGGATEDFGQGVRAFPLADGETGCGPEGQGVFACPVWATPLETGSRSVPPVLSANGTTVFANTGSVHALDASTGDVRWSTSATASSAPPALADDLLYVPADDGLHVYAAGGCGAQRCDALWVAATDEDDGPMTFQPAVAGSGDDAVVFGATASGAIHAYAAAGCGADTCEALWSADTSQITGAPAISDGRLLVSTASGVLAYGLS